MIGSKFTLSTWLPICRAPNTGANFTSSTFLLNCSLTVTNNEIKQSASMGCWYSATDCYLAVMFNGNDWVFYNGPTGLLIKILSIEDWI
jgi:hypothetical protein